MSGSRFYITAAIDYANGAPHIGHAIEKIGIDAMARYRRLCGQAVHFVLGMDEHGLKVQQSAEAAGISPQQWVDEIATRFEAAWRRLAIGFDDFIRTTQPRHERAVAEMVRRMAAAGDFYRGSYEGYYCVGCEAFKREDELVRNERDELRCPVHPGREVTWTHEENWFFRLSSYQDRLLRLFDEQPDFLQPEGRANEIRRVIEGGLEDISVSRARLPWGIPWPGDPEHTVYVWIDALTNYLAAAGFPDGDHERLWPADYHVIGKDITRFHCVYWPAMLMSAGLPLPRHVWAHGFINFGGAKLSKSEGVRFELEELIERHGPEALRYYLLREIPWNGDGEWSLERFDERYVSELANNLGNLANRTISMIERYRGGVVPGRRQEIKDQQIAAAVLRYRGVMDANLLHQGIAAAMELASYANGFVEARAPWAQAKDPARAAELDDPLAALARVVATLATLLQPFMPVKMAELGAQLSLPDPVPLDALTGLDLAGRPGARGPVLFPRPEQEKKPTK
ncbi:MAG: methionine--tRNA ligase [Gemmatimonadetes bacterium]|nr:methionine--tRNA ligase [Gemmatimonadota bacterium]